MSLPEVTLKGVKHYESMSEETLCFEATLYVDGKRLCRVSNRGEGGPHDYDSRQAHELDREIRAEGLTVTRDLGDGVTIDSEINLDSLVDDALIDALAHKDLKRLLRSQIVALTPEKKFIGFKKGLLPEIALLDAVRKAHPDHIILNCLTYPEAFELWRNV